MKLAHYRGFTFIEALLVLGLSALMLGTIISVVWNVFETSRLSERYQSAQLELVRVQERINYFIHNADAFESISTNVLSLGLPETSDTVTLTLRHGVLYFEQAGEQLALSGDRVYITDIQFETTSLSDSPVRYIGYELQGTTVGTPKPTTLSLRSGAEIRSFMTPSL